MALKAGKASHVAPPEAQGLCWVPAGVTRSDKRLTGGKGGAETAVGRQSEGGLGGAGVSRFGA